MQASQSGALSAANTSTVSNGGQITAAAAALDAVVNQLDLVLGTSSSPSLSLFLEPAFLPDATQLVDDPSMGSQTVQQTLFFVQPNCSTLDPVSQQVRVHNSRVPQTTVPWWVSPHGIDASCLNHAWLRQPFIVITLFRAHPS